MNPFTAQLELLTTMLPITTLLRLLSTLSITNASPPPISCPCTTNNLDKPPAFFLAGDSTTAINGGWGNGFLSFLQPPSWGVNHGHSGATTASFIAGGDWARVIANVKNNTSKSYPSIVTIQFGHNDQKEAAGISLAKFQSNLERLAKEVKDAGGVPVLVTSLTRRAFSGNNTVVDSLHNERLAAIAAVRETGSHFIDLNAASMGYVNALGRDNSQVYNLAEGDRTHLNKRGEKVFGRMVVDLLGGRSWNQTKTKSYGDGCVAEDGFPKGYLTRWFKVDDEMSDRIWSGQLA